MFGRFLEDRTRFHRLYSRSPSIRDRMSPYIPSFPETGASREHWGRAFWPMLHIMSLYYPRHPTAQEQVDMIHFLNAFTNILPCNHCKKHYYDFIYKHDLHDATTSRDKLFCFLVDLHNQVNRRNNKQMMTYQEAFQMYSMKATEPKG